MVTSSPGCGKSDIITQATQELGYEIAIEHPVISDSTDAKGLPAIVNGEADFMPYGNLRAMMNAKKPLVCFLDDLGQATQSVQASYMQLLLAREVGGKKISPEVRFVAATNGRRDGAGVTGLITPLLNRFRCVVKLDVSADDWNKWAMDNEVPVELIAFIQLRPELLNNFNEKTAKNMEPFASPRSVKFLADWISEGVMDIETWKGCVGEGFASEFSGFYKIFKQVGNLIPEIILNPKKARILEKPDEHYAICAALAYKATDKNIDAIGTYIERFSNAEYRTFVWKCASARDKDLCNGNAFQTWSIKHSDEMM
jgi:hypothetical protein